MDFINRNFSGMFKTIIIIAAVLVFVRIFPLIILVGLVGWGGHKAINYIKTYKSEKIGRKRKADDKNKTYEQQNYYDFSNKKVIDVDYEEVK